MNFNRFLTIKNTFFQGRETSFLSHEPQTRVNVTGY